MPDTDALNAAFRGDAKPDRDDAGLSRRELRAMRTRAQALSPMRILTQVLLVPVVTLAMTLSIYVRTSPYERPDALRHLAAMAGCDTARKMGLAPAYEGGLGYHARNDKDGDGIACGQLALASSNAPPMGFAMGETVEDAAPDARAITGAKFVKP